MFWTEGLTLIGPRFVALLAGYGGEKPQPPRIRRNLDGPHGDVRVGPDLHRRRGAFVGLRVSLSMLLGATLCWAVFVPVMQSHALITGSDFHELVQWTLWGGVACMVTSGLLSFALQWRSMVRAMANLRSMLSHRGRARSAVEEIEAPTSWFIAGQGLSLIAISLLAKATFDLPYWQSAMAVLLSFFLALVACRVTGETDTTPIGAMGKVTQLFFAAIHPGDTTVNLMSANITSGSAIAAADLLTDLKSGYLLARTLASSSWPSSPGSLSGPWSRCSVIGSWFPMRACWAVTSFPLRPRDVGRGGPSPQPRAGQPRLGQGLVDRPGRPRGYRAARGREDFPKHEKWIPSAAGIGLSWTFHWYFSLLFCVGAVIGYGVEKTWPKKSEEYLFPVASGIIAGGR